MLFAFERGMRTQVNVLTEEIIGAAADRLQGSASGLWLPARPGRRRPRHRRDQSDRAPGASSFGPTVVVPPVREVPGRIAVQLSRGLPDAGWPEAGRQQSPRIDSLDFPK